MGPWDGFLEVISGFLVTVFLDKRLCSSYYEEYQNSGLCSTLQVAFGVVDIKGDFSIIKGLGTPLYLNENTMRKKRGC